MKRVKKTFEPAYDQLMLEYGKHYVVNRSISLTTWKTDQQFLNSFFYRVQKGRLPLLAATVLETDPKLIEASFAEYADTVSRGAASSLAGLVERFYAYLLERGLVLRVPSLAVYRTGAHTPPKALTDEEVVRVFEVLPRHPVEWIEARNRAILHLYYDAELFPVQVFSLTRGDYDGCRVRITDARTRSKKERAMPEAVIGALERYLALLPVTLDREDRLFRHNDPKLALRKAAFSEEMRARSLAAGVQFGAVLLRMAGARNHVMSHRRRSANKTPAAWQTAWKDPFDFAELARAFEETHPRWGR
ncbi:hypothetical protein [Devosia sp. FJ2-5-3]|uniref:hypothetical protein n=1 Tax=Devosia sp. FJ2-5-3 TaxID=2976680 RepID=UPI0023D81C3F|nr:hypothetical protein [Devosia sp. FJ2-5-3]WEJ56769.1 hypothetical protein N0P34_11090 [Devosia sp. FJ2-5-3]